MSEANLNDEFEKARNRTIQNYMNEWGLKEEKTALDFANWGYLWCQKVTEPLQKCCDLYDVRNAEKIKLEQKLKIATEALEKVSKGDVKSDGFRLVTHEAMSIVAREALQALKERESES